MRGLIKHLAATTIAASRLEQVVNIVRGSRFPPLVVGYHQVVDKFRSDWRCGITPMQISAAMLERHLDWIGSRYNLVSLDEIGAHFETGEPFSKPLAAITFDDGYRDVYTNGFPILKRRGIPAAVFVVTDIVGTETPPLHDRLYAALVTASRSASSRMLADTLARMNIPAHVAKGLTAATHVLETMRRCFDALTRPKVEELVAAIESNSPSSPSVLDEARPLDWNMLSEMMRAGITIGSHTKSHVLLPAETSDRLLEEVVDSRIALQRHLHMTPRHFAYPDGQFDARAAHSVAAAGYRFAYTTCHHRLPGYPLMTIPRKVLWERSCVDSGGRFSGALMNCQAHRMFDWLSGCTASHKPATASSRDAAAAEHSAAHYRNRQGAVH